MDKFDIGDTVIWNKKQKDFIYCNDVFGTGFDYILKNTHRYALYKNVSSTRMILTEKTLKW